MCTLEHYSKTTEFRRFVAAGCAAGYYATAVIQLLFGGEEFAIRHREAVRMLVPVQFDMGELIFEITKPYIPDKGTRELVESTQWMVFIHRGTVSWFSGGPPLDTATRKTALFPDPKPALKAGVTFAKQCGLQEA
jgi:hypothetical protein